MTVYYNTQWPATYPGVSDKLVPSVTSIRRSGGLTFLVRVLVIGLDTFSVAPRDSFLVLGDLADSVMVLFFGTPSIA